MLYIDIKTSISLALSTCVLFISLIQSVSVSICCYCCCVCSLPNSSYDSFHILHTAFYYFKNCFFNKGVIQKVLSLRRGGGVIEKRTKKNAEIFKMKFYSYSPVFPIDYNGSMKY